MNEWDEVREANEKKIEAARKKIKPELHGRPRSISLSSLNVEPAYQRISDKRRVLKYLEKYNPAAVGVLLVGERDDGTLWVIDGQHRLYLLLLLGVKKANCLVIKSSGPKMEAEIFRVVNQQRKTPKSWEIFQARVTSGEPTATRILRTVQAAGFDVKNSRGQYRCKSPEKALECAGCLDKLYELGEGDLLSSSLAVMLAAFGMLDTAKEEREAYTEQILYAVALVVHNCKKVDHDRLAKVLCKKTPGGFKRAVADMAHKMGRSPRGGGGNKGLAAAALVSLYNKGLSAAKKLKHQDLL